MKNDGKILTIKNTLIARRHVEFMNQRWIHVRPLIIYVRISGSFHSMGIHFTF